MKKLCSLKILTKIYQRNFLKSYIVYIVVIIKIKTLYCGFWLLNCNYAICGNYNVVFYFSKKIMLKFYLKYH